MDFGAIYRRHVKGSHASPATTTTTVQLAITDMLFDEWLRIFRAFQIEPLRAFPKDAVTMPAHIDQIVKMKNSGMQWQCYNVMYRQKRGKKIARGSKKVSGWATLDVVLYLKCQAVKLQGRPAGQKGPTQRPSLGLTPSQASTRQPYVSAQSDERAPPGYQWHPPTPQYMLEVPGEGV